MKSSTAEPKSTDRQLRALEEAPHYTVTPHALPGHFLVERHEGRVYLTSEFGCTCPDYRKRGVPCKHMYLVAWEVEASRPAPVRPAAPAPLVPGSPAWKTEMARRRAQDFPAD